MHGVAVAGEIGRRGIEPPRRVAEPANDQRRLRDLAEADADVNALVDKIRRPRRQIRVDSDVRIEPRELAAFFVLAFSSTPTR
jgi:hypothetical protein